MSSRDHLKQEIDLLSEERAVVALAAVVEDRGLLATTDALPSHRDELRQAVADADLVTYAWHGTTPVTDGELARLVLEYAAAQDEATAETVSDAVEYARSPAERFDIASLGVIVPTLAILQTEVLVKRDSSGRWSLSIRKRAVQDSTLGKVLTALLSHITGSK